MTRTQEIKAAFKNLMLVIAGRANTAPELNQITSDILPTTVFGLKKAAYLQARAEIIAENTDNPALLEQPILEENEHAAYHLGQAETVIEETLKDFSKLVDQFVDYVENPNDAYTKDLSKNLLAIEQQIAPSNNQDDIVADNDEQPRISHKLAMFGSNGNAMLKVLLYGYDIIAQYNQAGLITEEIASNFLNKFNAVRDVMIDASTTFWTRQASQYAVQAFSDNNSNFDNVRESMSWLKNVFDINDSMTLEQLKIVDHAYIMLEATCKKRTEAAKAGQRARLLNISTQLAAEGLDQAERQEALNNIVKKSKLPRYELPNFGVAELISKRKAELVIAVEKSEQQSNNIQAKSVEDPSARAQQITTTREQAIIEPAAVEFTNETPIMIEGTATEISEPVAELQAATVAEAVLEIPPALPAKVMDASVLLSLRPVSQDPTLASNASPVHLFEVLRNARESGDQQLVLSAPGLDEPSMDVIAAYVSKTVTTATSIEDALAHARETLATKEPQPAVKSDTLSNIFSITGKKNTEKLSPPPLPNPPVGKIEVIAGILPAAE